MTYRTSINVTKLPVACNQPWHEADDRLLTLYASEGRSRAEIAVLLGRTPMGIQGRCQKIGVHLRRDTYGGDSPREYHRPHNEQRARQEACDRRMIQALALAFARGDHLPKSQVSRAA